MGQRISLLLLFYFYFIIIGCVVICHRFLPIIFLLLFKKAAI